MVVGGNTAAYWNGAKIAPIHMNKYIYAVYCLSNVYLPSLGMVGMAAYIT